MMRWLNLAFVVCAIDSLTSCCERWQYHYIYILRMGSFINTFFDHIYHFDYQCKQFRKRITLKRRKFLNVHIQSKFNVLMHNIIIYISYNISLTYMCALYVTGCFARATSTGAGLSRCYVSATGCLSQCWSAVFAASSPR